MTSQNIWISMDVPNIRCYPVSGQELAIRLYKTKSGIIQYPVSGRILYPVLSGTLPNTHYCQTPPPPTFVVFNIPC